MYNNRRGLRGLLLRALLIWAIASAAFAQAFPNKMMTMLVPYPAGGPTDFIARQIQPELQKILGQQMLVDNVGGVGGALGIQKVLQAPADGHTMVMASPMELMLAPVGLAAVKHKPEDLRLAALLVNTTMILLGRKDLPASTVDEIIEVARKPGAKALSFGSVGAGSMYHLVAEAFSRQTGVKMLHVPYKVAAPLLTGLMGGQIDIVFMPLAGNVGALVKEGKVKAYESTGNEVGQPMTPAGPDRLCGAEVARYQGIARSVGVQPQ